MRQLTLFAPEAVDALTLLRAGASLVLSVSGGKDSDAMAHYLLDLRSREQWRGSVCMVHADLGRAEWHSTAAYVSAFAERKNVPLYVVRHNDGDLIDRIWARWHTLGGKACPFPSAKARYCTSDLKKAPISRFIRQHFPGGTVICAMGLRAQESATRAKRATFALRTDSSAPTKGRLVYDWLPLHDWAESAVWQTIQAHGGNHHEAYTHGNKRLSCALCVLASENDLLNGARHNPTTYRELCRIEAVTGYSFRPNFWLSDLQPHLLPQTTRAAIEKHKQEKPT